MASVKKALLNTQGQIVETCKGSKVTVVGAGRLGTACAYTLLLKGICCNVVLVDKDEAKLRGEAMDLTHGSAFLKQATVDMSSDYELSEGSKVVVIAASARTQPGEDRKDLMRRNCDVIKDIVPKIVAKSPDCVLIVATPPVDVMTYAAWRTSGFPHHRVFGAGTNLASKRFRAMIADRLNVHHMAVDAWIIGEHGENSVPVWSSAGVGGVRLRTLVPTVGIPDRDPEEWNKFHDEIISSAKEVVDLKGHNAYAQALNVAALAKSVLKNTKQVMAVSTYIKGCKHGQDKAVYMSLPCVIGADGIAYIVKQRMEEDEKKLLHQAANKMFEEQTWLEI